MENEKKQLEERISLNSVYIEQIFEKDHRVAVMCTGTQIGKDNYIEARAMAESLALSENRRVATLPDLIYSLKCQEIYNHARALQIDTTSTQNLVLYKGDPAYVVLHGFGDLSKPTQLKVRDRYCFQPLLDWEDICKSGLLVHIEDIKKGKLAHNENYGVIVPIKGRTNQLVDRLNRDQWFKNDFVLAQTGSLESRELLGRMIFEVEGNEEVDNFSEYISEYFHSKRKFANPRGQTLKLDQLQISGIIFEGYIHSTLHGRFMVLSEDTVKCTKRLHKLPKKIVRSYNYPQVLPDWAIPSPMQVAYHGASFRIRPEQERNLKTLDANIQENKPFLEKIGREFVFKKRTLTSEQEETLRKWEEEEEKKEKRPPSRFF